MINLRGSRFTDIMPENLASQLETQAFAYALGRQIEKLCAYADGVHIYAAVASMPENILDVLAVELRTPAYNQKFSIEVKRALIEGTLTFYAHMGTPAACNQIIEIIFGAGYIEEWYDYDGDPHHFRACVGQNGGQINPEDLEEFRRVLGSVKRLSSWLDGVITLSTFEAEILNFISRMGRGYMSTPLPEVKKEYPLTAEIQMGGAFDTFTATTLPEVAMEYGMNANAYAAGIFGTITATAMPAAG